MASFEKNPHTPILTKELRDHRVLLKIGSVRMYPRHSWLHLSLFAPPTRTRQDCLLLFAIAFTPPTRTRQDSFVLSPPSFDEFCLVSTKFPISKSSVILKYLRLNSCKLETGSRQDKTVLSCLFRVGGVNTIGAVSYTHLTLPTIYSV